MPKFNKTVAELENHFEKWLFVLKNLHKLDRIPEELREHIFLKLFEIAEIAKFNPEEYIQYEESLKFYRDLKNSLDTAREEGKEEGREEGRKKEKIEIAKKLKDLGMSVVEIKTITGLNEDDLKNI
jgi:predicted transposase/invertase (TIGR01784 family)